MCESSALFLPITIQSASLRCYENNYSTKLTERNKWTITESHQHKNWRRINSNFHHRWSTSRLNSHVCHALSITTLTLLLLLCLSVLFCLVWPFLFSAFAFFLFFSENSSCCYQLLTIYFFVPFLFLKSLTKSLFSRLNSVTIVNIEKIERKKSPHH